MRGGLNLGVPGGKPPLWTLAKLFDGGADGLLYDAGDFANTAWTTSGKTTQVSAIGNNVGAVNDRSGNGHHMAQATAGARPTLQQDGSAYVWRTVDTVFPGTVTRASGNWSSSVYIAFTIKTTGSTSPNNQFMVIAGTNSTHYLGVVRDGNGSPISNSAGTVTVRVDGGSITESQDGLHAAICDGAWHVLEFIADLSSANFDDFTFMSYGTNSDWHAAADLSDLVMVDTPSVADQSKARRYLASKVRLTL